MLYSLLGDPASNDNPECTGKAQMLLGPEYSVLGKCSQDLLQLLDEWLVGGSARRPWCLLDIVGAPVNEHGCMVFARCTIFRMSTSISRRYVTRYSTWPYLLYTLCNGKSTEVEKQDIARKLFAARKEELDVYTTGIKALLDTPEKLFGKRCRERLLGRQGAALPPRLDNLF